MLFRALCIPGTIRKYQVPGCVCTQNHEKNTPAQLSLVTLAAQHSAVRCRGVSCCAVLCRASLCFLFRTYQTATLASGQSWREPEARVSSSILYSNLLLSLLFSFFVFVNLLVYCCTGIQHQPNPTSMLSLSIYSSTASTAQHSTMTPAQSSKPSTCRSEYKSKEVPGMYVHACGVRVVSLEHGALGF